MMEYDVVPPSQAKRMCTFVIASSLLMGMAFFLVRPIIIPLGLSALFAYLLHPVVAHLNKYISSRFLCVSVLLTVFFLISGIIILKVFPFIYRELYQLLRRTPELVSFAVRQWLPLVKDFLEHQGLSVASDIDLFLNDVKAAANLSGSAQQAVLTILSSIPKVMGTLMNFVLTPFFTFVLLLHRPRITKVLWDLVPREVLSSFAKVVLLLDRTLQAVIKGQLVVAFILSILYSVGFQIIGLQTGLAIGFVAGICRIVPYLDIIVAGAFGCLVIISTFYNVTQFASLFVVIAIVQALDGMLITPRIVGDRVGLHPAVVIASVFAFGSLLGFWGILFAIPVTALIKVTSLIVIASYKSSKLYNSES